MKIMKGVNLIHLHWGLSVLLILISSAHWLSDPFWSPVDLDVWIWPNSCWLFYNTNV